MSDPRQFGMPVYQFDTAGQMIEAALRVTSFHSGAASAVGSTALWTPVNGLRFRLMRYCIMLSGQAILAAPGILLVRLLDGTIDTQQNARFFVPLISVGALGLVTTPWIDLGNGILSGAADRVLNINLSAAVNGGGVVHVICAGKEE